MTMIFLYGPAGVGKLTVGRELSRLTGFKLFHNHLIVDALLAVFEFGSPPFIRLREQMWRSVFEEAARADRSLIFTFAPEATVGKTFVDETRRLIDQLGGRICFVELACPADVLEQRIPSASRAAFLKLRSAQVYRELAGKGAFDYPAIPADLSVSTLSNSPEQSARRIVEFFGLPSPTPA